MCEVTSLGRRMMSAAETYPNIEIANAFCRVGDKLIEHGSAFARPLTETDKLVVQFFQNNFVEENNNE